MRPEGATESMGLSRVELDTLFLDLNSRLSVALSGRAPGGGFPRSKDLGCSVRPFHGHCSMSSTIALGTSRQSLRDYKLTAVHIFDSTSVVDAG
jgi:hypothetical protein